jgi:hypothetical protein
MKLALIHPPGNSDQYKPEGIKNWRHVCVHYPLGKTGIRSSVQEDRVSGPYGVKRAKSIDDAHHHALFCRDAFDDADFDGRPDAERR